MYKVVLTFESVDEILQCENSKFISNKSEGIYENFTKLRNTLNVIQVFIYSLECLVSLTDLIR